MKTKYFTWLCTILSFLLLSCEKEFDPRDKYKDITIVYGLINPLESIHYIRICRAFYAPESVTIVAQNPDSLYYPVEDIDVRVYEITPTGNSTPLEVGTTIIHAKDTTGYFYAKEQRVYYFNKKFHIQHLENTIKIEIEHKKSGKIVYAETPLVNDFEVIIPRSGARPNLNPNPQQAVTKFEWNNAKNGRIYDIYYIMYYKEGHIDKPLSAWEKDSVVWHVGSHSAPKTGDGEVQPEVLRFNSATFYDQVQKKVAYNDSLRRRPYVQAKTTIWSGSEVLYHYHNVNGHPTPLPEVPEYTNLKTTLNSVELENEAFGIFTSRIAQQIHIFLSDHMMMSYLPNVELVNRQFIPVPIIVDE